MKSSLRLRVWNSLSGRIAVSALIRARSSGPWWPLGMACFSVHGPQDECVGYWYPPVRNCEAELLSGISGLLFGYRFLSHLLYLCLTLLTFLFCHFLLRVHSADLSWRWVSSWTLTSRKPYVYTHTSGRTHLILNQTFLKPHQGEQRSADHKPTPTITNNNNNKRKTKEKNPIPK